MADDEEINEEELLQQKKKKQRPPRREVVHECDVTKPVAAQIIEFGHCALDDETLQKNQAQYVKAQLDRELGGTWHCIVGTHFGGNVTNDANTLINFQLDNSYFMCFRSGPPEKAPVDPDNTK